MHQAFFIFLPNLIRLHLSIDNIVKYLGIALFFVLIQVLFVNNINISGLGLTPHLYIVALLLLPFEIQPWLLLVFAFVTGLSVDTFDDTGGVHASALVATAFVRPVILRILSPRDGYESGTKPRVFYFGVVWFARYAVIIVFLHHFLYFYLEVFTFDRFFYTFATILLNTIFTLIFIILSQFLIFRK